MTRNQIPRVSAGKMLAGIILAIVMGVLLPFITMLEMGMLCPLVMIGGVLTVFLRYFAGWIPAVILMGIQSFCNVEFFGLVPAGMLFVASVLPSVFVLRGMERTQPFFEQMRNALVAYLMGLAAAVVIAYMAFGSDMIARLMDIIREQIELLPDDFMASLVEAIKSALSVSEGTTNLAGITVDSVRKISIGMVDAMQITYVHNLPGSLLAGAVISAILSVLWGNWMMARRGIATRESFIGMSKWFLPARMTYGLMFLWVASYILVMSGYASGETVYITIYYLMLVVFTVQALSSFDRRFLRRGMSGRKRAVLIVLILLLGNILLPSMGNTILLVYGLASALFGSHGAIRLAMQRFKDENSDHNDPDQ